MDAIAILALLAALVVSVMNLLLAPVFPSIRLLLLVFFSAAAILTCRIVWILESVSRKETAALVEELTSSLKLCLSEKDNLVAENTKMRSHVADLEAEFEALKDSSSSELRRALEGNDKLIISGAGLKSRILHSETDNMLLKAESEARRVEMYSKLELALAKKNILLGEKGNMKEEVGVTNKALVEAQQLALNLSSKLQQALQEKDTLLARLVAPIPNLMLIPAVAMTPVIVGMPRHKPREPRIGPKNWEKSESLAVKLLMKRHLRQVHEDARKKAAQREREVLMAKLKRENDMCRAELEMRGEDTSDFEEETLEEFERRQDRFFGL